MAVFWVVAPRSLQGLMTEAARTSETLVNFYQTTRCNNPEDSRLKATFLFLFLFYIPFLLLCGAQGPPFGGDLIYLDILVGLLGRGIGPSQGLYLYTGQHNTERRGHIHGLSGIRNHGPSDRATQGPRLRL
ncbi:hypothetical protein L798_00317 [Zootermopsis nevadensis]|uniref:Uncharacterized protein n=1 Tax=Zootermopsis nevadensis TaxID=136037 RepID=A0A067QKV9_ZOONE|nr:hypothetical protein L798_00317 [Zootermopsis nevadensis]